jgi:hypothetical protein
LSGETNQAADRRNELVTALEKHISDILDRYRTQLGENAYALFNAITDFASHPPELRDFHRTPHAMQVCAGTWSHEFAHVIAKNGSFDFEKYLQSNQKPGGPGAGTEQDVGIGGDIPSFHQVR